MLETDWQSHKRARKWRQLNVLLKLMHITKPETIAETVGKKKEEQDVES